MRIGQRRMRMEDGIVVSVYCLAYNHEQYIRDACAPENELPL